MKADSAKFTIVYFFFLWILQFLMVVFAEIINFLSDFRLFMQPTVMFIDIKNTILHIKIF